MTMGIGKRAVPQYFQRAVSGLMVSFCENYHSVSNCSHIGANPAPQSPRRDTARMYVYIQIYIYVYIYGICTYRLCIARKRMFNGRVT